MKKFIFPLLICFFTVNIAFSQDNDGDGYDENLDCNDSDPSINPGQYEDYCNQDGIDNNCDGLIDENYDYNLCNGGGGPYDNDGDGYDEFSDCNDWDASINPGQYEDYCNQDGIDNDCNGMIDENFDYNACFGGTYDNDGDGYDEVEDCNDWDSSVNPGQYEDECNQDGVDNNCDGLIDENYDYNACNGIYDNDGDGFDSLTDCDDSNFDINPGALEICDDQDNDCDGLTDEGLNTTVYYVDNDGDGYGSGSAGDFCNDPGIGYTLNNDDCNDDDFAINPGTIEVANNGIDEDCNGEDLDLTLGQGELAETTIKLSPNPGNNTLSVKTNQKESFSVRILDNQGKTVLNSTFFPEQNNTIELNTSEFPKGTYQVVIQNDKQFFRSSWVKI